MIHGLLLFILAAIPLSAQTQNPAKADQGTVVRVAEKAAIAALNFRQGDAASLARARADFTPEGWQDFMKHMAGFVDQKGAPTFTSTFVPSRSATVLGEDRGVVRFRDTLNNQLFLNRLAFQNSGNLLRCEPPVLVTARPAGPIRPRFVRRTDLRPRQQQLLATDKEIDQRTGDKQAVRVLLQPAIAHFHEPELQL